MISSSAAADQGLRHRRRRLPVTLVLAVIVAGSAARAQTLPSLSAAPASLAFAYTIGAAALPPAQTVSLKSSTTSTVLTCAITVSPAAPWLIVTPVGGNTPVSLSVRANPTGLGAGAYSTGIVITSAGAGNSPISVAVTLSVKNPAPTMAVAPSALTFDYATDALALPVAQTLSIATNGEPVSFTSTASGGTWLSITPANGISLLGRPVTLTVSAQPAGLLPATYSGKITITSSNASNRTLAVQVSLVVAAGTAVLTSIWPPDVAVGSPDTTITLVGSHLFPGSVIHVGATAVSSTWVGPEVLLAAVPAALLSTQGTLAITATNAPQPASNALNWDVTAPGPRIWAVVNAASYVAGSPTAVIAPGEMVAVFGSGLGPVDPLLAAPSGGAYPTILGAAPATTQVQVEVSTGTWVSSPVILAQANQVNAVVPFNMTPASGMKMRVIYNGVTSATYTVDGVSADPGVFTVDSSGRGQAAVLNFDSVASTYSLNSAANAAAKGSIILIYASGGGATTILPSPEGQVVPVSPPLPTLTGTTTVTIGADTISPDYAGAVPTAIAGLVQINATIPAAAKTNKTTPLLVTIGGRTSPTGITISVK